MIEKMHDKQMAAVISTTDPVERHKTSGAFELTGEARPFLVTTRDEPEPRSFGMRTDRDQIFCWVPDEENGLRESAVFRSPESAYDELEQIEKTRGYARRYALACIREVEV